jgi:hypothetical protein
MHPIKPHEEVWNLEYFQFDAVSRVEGDSIF